MKKNLMVLTKVKITGNARDATMEGKRYRVFPVVIMVEGVHNGSTGPVLYLRKDMEKYAAAWNYKPIVVYHPKVGDTYVSANSPNILTKSKIGVILNNTVKLVGRNYKQFAEAWIESGRIEKVNNGELTKKLTRGESIEVSTGLFATFQEKEGTWNGEQYHYVAREYRPDHLAVLPDQVGACSLKDGCGLFAASEKNKNPSRMVVFNSIMENKSVSGKSKVHNCSCQKGKRMIKNKKKKKMTKAQFVEALVENSPIWNEEDVELLMNMDQDTLKKLKEKDEEAIEANEERESKEAINSLKAKLKAKKEAALANQAEEEEEEEEESPAANAEKKSSKKQSKNKEEMALNSLLKNADPELRKRIKRGLAAEKLQRERYMDIILSNESNAFEEAELAEFDLVKLKKIADFAVHSSDEEEVDEDDEDETAFFGNMSSARRENKKKESGQPVLAPPSVYMRPKKAEKSDS